MNARPQLAWFALAVSCAAALAWTHRYEYAACDTDGCVAIHRWTGSITFREARWAERAPEAQVARLDARSPRRGGRGRESRVPRARRGPAPAALQP